MRHPIEDTLDDLSNLNDKLRNEMTPYRTRMKKAAEEGLLLFIKYALLIGLIYFSVNIFSNIIAGASNGTSAAIYLNQLQNKGYLPKVGQDGQVPPKQEEPNAKNQ
jgi:hypothetical protein